MFGIMIILANLIFTIFGAEQLYSWLENKKTNEFEIAGLIAVSFAIVFLIITIIMTNEKLLANIVVSLAILLSLPVVDIVLVAGKITPYMVIAEAIMLLGITAGYCLGFGFKLLWPDWVKAFEDWVKPNRKVSR